MRSIFPAKLENIISEPCKRRGKNFDRDEEHGLLMMLCRQDVTKKELGKRTWKREKMRSPNLQGLEMIPECCQFPGKKNCKQLHSRRFMCTEDVTYLKKKSCFCCRIMWRFITGFVSTLQNIRDNFDILYLLFWCR